MTPEEMARTLVSCFPDDREHCVEALRNQFPDADANKVVDEARAWHDALEWDFDHAD